MDAPILGRSEGGGVIPSPGSDCVSRCCPILLSQPADPPEASSAQSDHGLTHNPLSCFSMETMKKLFHILQTLFLVPPFATEALASFSHLRGTAFH